MNQFIVSNQQMKKGHWKVMDTVTLNTVCTMTSKTIAIQYAEQLNRTWLEGISGSTPGLGRSLPRYEITGETHERSPHGEWMKTREVLAVLQEICLCHWAADAQRLAKNAKGTQP